MEKPLALDGHQEQLQQQKQQVLKCPRCCSSNTKFCYYNNYSLSQPRHFCKACKRYWTRGGTLRNVPVGGGCRKNKRVKIPSITTTTTTTTATTHAVVTTSTLVDHDHDPISNPNLDRTTSSNNNSNHHLDPLFYGLLPQNPNYPRFDARVPSVNNTLVTRYDFSQPQMNDLGLGFSSSDPGAAVVANHSGNSSSFLTTCPSSLFVDSSSLSSSGTPTMASILASGHQQREGFMDWNNKIEAVGSSDPTSLLWNATAGGGGGWFDPTNSMGFSVPSLI